MMFRFLLGACLTLLAVVFSISTSTSAEAEQRYIVIGNTVAEIVSELILAGQIVGVGSGLDHIEAFRGIPVIRGFRLTSAENLLALRPTAVLITERQTRPELVVQLRGAGVRVEVFPDKQGKAAVVEKIHHLGRLLDRQEAAAALAERFSADWDAAIASVGDPAIRPRGLFILSGGGRPTLVGGRDTHPAHLIELAGGANVVEMMEGYKPLSQEAMVALAPQFIIINNEGMTPVNGSIAALSAPGAMMTPAARDGRIITLSAGALTGPGILTPKAIRELAAKIRNVAESP